MCTFSCTLTNMCKLLVSVLFSPPFLIKSFKREKGHAEHTWRYWSNASARSACCCPLYPYTVVCAQLHPSSMYLMHCHVFFPPCASCVILFYFFSEQLFDTQPYPFALQVKEKSPPISEGSFFFFFCFSYLSCFFCAITGALWFILSFVLHFLLCVYCVCSRVHAWMPNNTTRANILFLHPSHYSFDLGFAALLQRFCFCSAQHQTPFNCTSSDVFH